MKFILKIKGKSSGGMRISLLGLFAMIWSGFYLDEKLYDVEY